MKQNTYFILTLSLVAGWMFIPGKLGAATATLSSSTKTPEVGQPFTIVLSVDGTRVSAPDLLDAPSMTIERMGQSRQFQFGTGGARSTVAYTYQAIAEKEGTVTIPSVEVEADGRKIKSNPLVLEVVKNAGGPRLQPHLGTIPMPGFGGARPRGQDGTEPKIDEETAFLKIVPERTQLYVGETVEVEMKAYVDTELDLIDFDRELRLPGEDFIIQPSVGPNVSVQNRGLTQYYDFEKEKLGDREYHVLTFRTSLTAVKPGEFVIEPLEYRTAIRIPRPDRRRPRSLLDSVFGDPFDDPAFLLDPRGSQRGLILKSEPLAIHVVPLPTEGRPENYDGAIGRFSLEVEADKTALAIDEPLTLTSKVTGHGNFERIKNVTIPDSPAWKAYPVKADFHTADELKLSGEKVFEQTFIAAGQSAQAPQVSFSYFDPVAKEYVVLEGPEIPVAITGRPRAAEPDSPSDRSSEYAGEAIPFLTADTDRFEGPPRSALESPLFLAANGGALLAFVGFLLWKMQKRHHADTDPKRVTKRRRREAANHLAVLREMSDPAGFADEAAALLALIARIPSSVPPQANPQPTPTSDDPHAEGLASLTRWIDQVRWSSRSQVEESFGHHRGEWLAALESLVAKSFGKR